jgi:hypothetical protein
VVVARWNYNPFMFLASQILTDQLPDTSLESYRYGNLLLLVACGYNTNRTVIVEVKTGG